MIKSELIAVITSQTPGLYSRDVDLVVVAILDGIADALANGDRVELRGFGVFSVRCRPMRAGRNPKTGASVFVEEKWVPFFRAGREMQDRLNPDKDELPAHEVQPLRRRNQSDSKKP